MHLDRRLEQQLWLPCRRKVGQQVGDEVVTDAAAGWVVPTVVALQRVVREVVELTFRAVVHRSASVGRQHPACPGDGAQVYVDAEQLAVPLGQHPLEATRRGIVVVDRQ